MVPIPCTVTWAYIIIQYMLPHLQQLSGLETQALESPVEFSCQVDGGALLWDGETDLLLWLCLRDRESVLGSLVARMAIMSGPILVALAVNWSGRLVNWATSAPWLDALVFGVVSAVYHSVQAGITLCGFFVPLHIQGPYVG